MVIEGVVFILCLIFSFFHSKKEGAETGQYVANFAGFGFCGLILGGVISYGLGNFVLPSHYVLKEVSALESAEINGERFLLKERNNWGAACFSYFIKEGDEIVAKPIAEENIKYEKGGSRVEKVFKKELKNKNLDWFFFCATKYSEVVISGEDDIYDDRRSLLIDF